MCLWNWMGITTYFEGHPLIIWDVRHGKRKSKSPYRMHRHAWVVKRSKMRRSRKLFYFCSCISLKNSHYTFSSSLYRYSILPLLVAGTNSNHFLFRHTHSYVYKLLAFREIKSEHKTYKKCNNIPNTYTLKLK